MDTPMTPRELAIKLDGLSVSGMWEYWPEENQRPWLDLIAQRDALLLAQERRKVVDVALIAHNEQARRLASLEQENEQLLRGRGSDIAKITELRAGYERLRTLTRDLTAALQEALPMTRSKGQSSRWNMLLLRWKEISK